MSAIKGRNTKPELLVRRFLFGRGFRYRLNDPRLPGHPDLVLRKYRTVIFVNGCFWHGHEGCRYFVLPKTNAEFWRRKIERNHRRDVDEQQKLSAMGWHSITVWECQLKPKVRQQTLEALEYTLCHIFLNDRRLALQDDRAVLSDGQSASRDGLVLVQDESPSVNDRRFALQDDRQSLDERQLAMQDGKLSPYEPPEEACHLVADPPAEYPATSEPDD